MAEPSPPVDLKSLHAKISEFTFQNDLIPSAVDQAGFLSTTMINLRNEFPLARQADLLWLDCGNLYQVP